MLSWMIYVVVVTALLSGAAFAAEYSAQLRKAPTRWIWATGIVASLVIPALISSVSIQIPSLSSVIDSAGPARPVPLHEITSGTLAPSVWLSAATGSPLATPDLDTALTRAWVIGSGVLVMAILLNGVLVYRRKRHWQRDTVARIPVYVAEDIGPAVVGLLRPRIVVPRWLMSMPASEQELVIAHEQSHLHANDAQVLAIAILLIVAMPWNLPLWWQLRRLRRAIEFDCDARVLGQGHDPARYGAALVNVGERQSNPVMVVAAMAESHSFLEQRIRKMVSKRRKFASASAVLSACLGLALVAGAAEVSPAQC